MSFSERYIPLQGVNVDLSPALLPNNLATFIKNLTYSIEDSSNGNTGEFKTLQANSVYDESFTLPDGDNKCIGALSLKETGQVFVWVYNSRGNHTNFVINGWENRIDIIAQGDWLNYQLNPENFIHEGAATVSFIFITDPDTGQQKRKTFLIYTDGYNPQRYTCVEDAIDSEMYTDGIYFSGDYDRSVFYNMGLNTPQDQIQITDKNSPEFKRNNTMLFTGWQFRLRGIDVWGRPTEYSIISNTYIPGINDCISTSSNISNCVELRFKNPPPNIDKLEVAFRKNNSAIWYTADTIDLYKGNVLGKWWQRAQSGEVVREGDTIVYTFCNDKECRPISRELTSRLENPLARTSIGATMIGKSLGLSNNKYGFEKISKEILDGIKTTVTPPESLGDIAPRTITIYVPIYNKMLDNFQLVFKDKDSYYLWGDNSGRHGGAIEYDQRFKNDNQSGFYGYLVGGGAAISTQVYVSNDGELIDDVNHDGGRLSQLRYRDSGYTMQKFEFTNIPAGVYCFRLASHRADPNSDLNIRNTSTTVWGVCNLTRGELIPDVNSKRDDYELVIDVCDEDYNTLDKGEMMVIFDGAAFKRWTDRQFQTFPIPGWYPVRVEGSSRLSVGYITENVSGDEIPVETVLISDLSNRENTTFYRSNKPGGYASKADHNGFYWHASFIDGRQIKIGYDFYYKCSRRNYTLTTGADTINYRDLDISSIDGNVYSDYSSLKCNRILYSGRLILGGTDIGMPNTTILVTGSTPSTTDSDGRFTVILHDEASGGRKESLIIGNGVCRLSLPDGSCIKPMPVNINGCNECSDEDRRIDIGDIVLSSVFAGRGLLSGGTYAVGVSLKDEFDRSTFVQDLGYINIPSFAESNVFAPSTIRVDIDSGVQFPNNFKSLVFNISKETTIRSYLTWIVDRFDFVDNTGNINTLAPTQIKIYYKSLIEYNKQNAYNTTAQWGFINEGVESEAVTNDNVIFLANGDGVPFEKTITSRVKYDKAGNYFLINYTEDLKDLKPNAFVRLYRMNDCEEAELMFEVDSVKLNNGIPEVTSFNLSAFDTYYVNREIPVPISAGTEDEDETVNERRIFAYPFEHDSPSDFWGKGLNNFGRVNVKNPYETVVYHRDEVAMSGSFSDNGYVNYLSFFENELKFTFDQSNLNGIISVIAKPGVVMIIGQNNNIVVGYNDNLVRAKEDGTLEIPSTNSLFGRPSPNPRFAYGCQLVDKNTISDHNGDVHWLDGISSCIVKHNFRDTLDITAGVCSFYVRSKIKKVREGGGYFIAVSNPLTSEYMVTDKVLHNSLFVNHKREIDLGSEETFFFDIASGRFKGWYAITAEYYAGLEGDSKDQQLFSFKNGIPYFHYSQNRKFGKVFGESVDRVIEIVMNSDSLKKKKGLSISTYSRHRFFSDRIVTELNQKSYIPLSQWNQGDGFWSAPILCDEDSPGGIFDGDMLLGGWIKIRLVGDIEDNDIETKLMGITVEVFPQEKSGTK